MMTVKEVADLTGITVKTLHHYHKIDLLKPSDRSSAGYRLYGKEELKILQEILFYRELDIPLKEIKKLIQENKSRIDVLQEQRYLMQEKKKHLNSISDRINEAIEAEVTGNEIDESTMFRGITLRQWMDHIEDHSEEIEQKYDVDISEIDLDDPNLHQALKDVEAFIQKVEHFIESNVSVNDPQVQVAIEDFLTEWNATTRKERLTIEDLIDKGYSYLTDDFQRKLLPSQHLGLRAYLYVACLEYKNK